MMPITAKMSPVHELSRSQVVNFASAGAAGANSSRINASFNAQLSSRFLEPEESRILTHKLENVRPKPKFIYKATESSDEEANEQFTVNPADDIPKNKLVDKLVRGLQHFI